MNNSFNIEIIPQAYPSYPSGIILRKPGSPYVKFHTRVTFNCGTILDNYAGDWIYLNKYYESLDQILEHLPQDIQTIILFNIEIFRKI